MALSVQVPTVGLANSTEAVKVSNSLTNLSAWANGNIAATDLAAAVAQSAGVNATSTVKGAVNIAATESRTNVAYGTLTTPDQVTGIVLPTNGLLVVWYQATWQTSVINAARAAIFLGANQLKANNGSNTPVVQEVAPASGQSNWNESVTTFYGGLLSSGSAVSSYTGDVTTGQLVGGGASSLGGPAVIFAAAGTYTVSVQFKASSGTVAALNRRLWVQALSFT